MVRQEKQVWGGGGVSKYLHYLIGLVFVLAMGCVATPQPNRGVTACEDGVLKPCTCVDGSKSTQLCSGGTYDLCDCPENRVADGGGTAGDASARVDANTGTDANAGTDANTGTDANAGTDANTGTDSTTSTDGAASDTTGPAPSSCQSDKDCKDAGKVCDPLTKQCVTCLTDAECGPSQHCVGLTCQGYTTCSNSLGCKAAKGPDGKDQPICDQTIGECSACLSAADCPPSHDCKAKQCLPFKTCQNSTECSKDEVCDKAISRCVQCLGDNDCAANQLCEQGKCNSFIPCSSDKQCTDKGLLCDQGKGKCAQCLGNSDCPGIYNCQNVGVAKTGLCVLDVCAQGQGACSNNQKVTCNAVGDGFGSPESCPAQTTCVAPGGKPSCKAWACTPGASCQGDKAVECSADGLEVVKTTDCAAGAQKCLNGQCKSLLCEPATQYCDGNVVKQCAADGLSATPQQTCGPAEFCQNAQCKPIVCAPGQPACDGKVATTCNAQGSGYTGATVDCAAKGQVCSGGLCKQLVCDPQNSLYCDGNVVKQCDPGGMSATPLQTCGAAQYCDKGVCQAQVCTPGAPACNGTVKTTCNANGSGYVAGGTDCKASGLSCSAGKCVGDVCDTLEFGGVAYRFCETAEGGGQAKALSWSDAEADCIANNGHLLTINTASEWSFVNNTLNSKYKYYGTSIPWIGYSDQAQEGVFKWVSGQAGYAKWQNGEPQGGNKENCVDFNNGDSQGYRDDNCANPKSYICEQSSDSCDVYQFGGVFYRFCETADGGGKAKGLNWSDAEADCVAHNGHLVTINTAAEWAFINDTLNSKYKYYGTSIPWIGYSDQAQEGVFKWVSGQAGYAKWQNGEPQGGNKENCVDFNNGNSQGYRDDNCANPKSYICEPN